jgi:signal transduction histidine kinase
LDRLGPTGLQAADLTTPADNDPPSQLRTTSSGGIAVPRLRLTARSDEVELAIEDDGTGFDPSVALRSGGQGLHLIRQRVQDLGGRLEVESKAGRGTRIRVRLPRPTDGVEE